MTGGRILVGTGGWKFAPWRGSFYPKGLPQRRELEFASRALTSIEINGTYYSRFPQSSWQRWRDETPHGFVFAIKGSRVCTQRRRLTDAGAAISGFTGQGLHLLGDRLGPINWQLAENKPFDPEEIEAFLSLLPRTAEGVPLRHALEVRHASFVDPRFYALARRHDVAIVFADHERFPAIDEPTASFTYARLMRTRDDEATGYSPTELDRWADRARRWAARGDVFIYFIAGAKHRAPAAARALIERTGGASSSAS